MSNKIDLYTASRGRPLSIGEMVYQNHSMPRILMSVDDKILSALSDSGFEFKQDFGYASLFLLTSEQSAFPNLEHVIWAVVPKKYESKILICITSNACSWSNLDFSEVETLDKNFYVETINMMGSVQFSLSKESTHVITYYFDKSISECLSKRESLYASDDVFKATRLAPNPMNILDIRPCSDGSLLYNSCTKILDIKDAFTYFYMYGVDDQRPLPAMIIRECAYGICRTFINNNIRIEPVIMLMQKLQFRMISGQNGVISFVSNSSTDTVWLYISSKWISVVYTSDDDSKNQHLAIGALLPMLSSFEKLGFTVSCVVKIRGVALWDWHDESIYKEEPPTWCRYNVKTEAVFLRPEAMSPIYKHVCDETITGVFTVPAYMANEKAVQHCTSTSWENTHQAGEYVKETNTQGYLKNKILESVQSLDSIINLTNGWVFARMYNKKFSFNSNLATIFLVCFKGCNQVWPLVSAERELQIG